MRPPLPGYADLCVRVLQLSHVFIYTYKLKVSGAHAPLGPTVDTPLLFGIIILHGT